MRLAVWSGPRNLSTALMYSFAARPDCTVWDEPFYAAYLAASGADHPMRAEIVAAHDADPDRVGSRCGGEIPQGKSLFYQKHMTLHMLDHFDRGFMRRCRNVFLIRHPARVLASYVQKRERPALGDLGFVQQAALFDEVADWSGETPLVVDSADLRDDPRGVLSRLCAALGLAFDPAMLSWPAGPKPFDGVWAPHWYGAVHLSEGFAGAEGPMPALGPAATRLADAAMPAYDRLAQFRI